MPEGGILNAAVKKILPFDAAKFKSADRIDAA